MITLWLGDMEAELWSIMYQATSDAFAAWDVFHAFQWRIYVATDLPTDGMGTA
jgi:hypothetical protein